MRALTARFAPSISTSLVQISTSNRPTPLRPLFTGELALTLENWHTLGIEAASTSDFINANLNTNNVYYGNLGLFYRYRFVGGPVRAPQFPLNPQYGPIRFKRTPITDAAYGPAFNMDIGARLYFSSLRGLGAAPVDPELARSYQGANITLSFDRRVDDFRVHGKLEGGYSVLRGKLMTGGISGAFTYDKWPQISPGLCAGWYFISGQALGESGVLTEVSNQMLSFGTIMIFKM